MYTEASSVIVIFYKLLELSGDGVNRPPLSLLSFTGPFTGGHIHLVTARRQCNVGMV